jgi:hypothetical protein
MMMVPADLRRFVREHRDDLTLSVYVESTPSDPAERRSWEVLVRQGIGQARDSIADAPQEEQDAFERCATRILERLPDPNSPRGEGGWACFCTATEDLLEVDVPESHETSVAWGLGARIVPYLRAAEEEDALVVHLDREKARVSRYERGALREVLSLTSDMPHAPVRHMGDTPRAGFHQGQRGVAATDDLQRQRREATERLFHNVARKLANPGEDALPIVLTGTPETTAHFINMLPGTMTERCVVASSLHPGSSGADVTQAVRGALRVLRSRAQSQRVSALQDSAYADGRAALGMEDARRAADLGAIAELMFSDRAWKEHPREIESLVQRALAEGAEVTFANGGEVESANGEADGVVAGLRFPIPTPR